MLGWGKTKIGSAEFVELFYDFAHTVAHGGLGAGKDIYQKYFPGIALEKIGNERMVFVFWWLDVKLVETKSDKRSDVMLGVIGKYLASKGQFPENLLESQQFMDIRMKFADYYDSAAQKAGSPTLLQRFLNNIADGKTLLEDSARGVVINRNMAEIMEGIESQFMSKYKIQ